MADSPHPKCFSERFSRDVWPPPFTLGGRFKRVGRRGEGRREAGRKAGREAERQVGRQKVRRAGKNSMLLYQSFLKFIL
jgi:hypothetical protein